MQLRKKYISRAGVKLEHALKHFQIDPTGKICLDVGAATGGFTDCLLQAGAAKVYTVETGYGVLDWKLRKDPRVVVRERSNILYQLDIPKNLDLAVVDTSWTKLRLSVPAASRFMKPGGIILALVKPQYEAPKADLVRGIVPAKLAPQIAQQVKSELENLGFVVSEVEESPITGESGNHEYWLKLVLQ